MRCGFDAEAPWGLQPRARQAVGVLLTVLTAGLLLGCAALLASGNKEATRLGAYFGAPLIALVVVVSRLLVPRRAERTR